MSDMTRVRLEATSELRLDVEDELIVWAARLRDMFGGQWKLEHDLEVQTTKSGYWGRLTMTRIE